MNSAGYHTHASFHWLYVEPGILTAPRQIHLDDSEALRASCDTMVSKAESRQGFGSTTVEIQVWLIPGKGASPQTLAGMALGNEINQRLCPGLIPTQEGEKAEKEPREDWRSQELSLADW